MYCSSCHCSPCCCITSTEAAPTDCIDPGITSIGSYGSVLDENLCPKRLLPYRGDDASGNPETNPSKPLRGGVLTHTPEGVVRWSDGPCNAPPAEIIRVSTNAMAADPLNYIHTLIGKGPDNCDRCVLGSPDAASGVWKMVWSASMQGWTTIPDRESDFAETCTTLSSDVVLDPGNVGGYLLHVESTTMMSEGVSVMVGGYELVAVEIVDATHVRVEQVEAPAGPVNVEAGSAICVIGFRPCPRTEEPFITQMTGCFEDHVVAFQSPVDVATMKVPGIIWRDQLGRWSMVPAPVDPTTGIVTPNRYLSTPSTPAAAVANLPVFRTLPSFHFVTPVVVFTQTTSGTAAAQVLTVTMSGTTGYVAGATAVLLGINMWGVQGSGASGSHTYLKINETIRGHTVLSGPFSADSDNNQILIPLPADTNIKFELTVTTPTPAGAGFQCHVTVDAYLAP